LNKRRRRRRKRRRRRREGGGGKDGEITVTRYRKNKPKEIK